MTDDDAKDLARTDYTMGHAGGSCVCGSRTDARCFVYPAGLCMLCPDCDRAWEAFCRDAPDESPADEGTEP